jgi:hypothetical protein
VTDASRTTACWKNLVCGVAALAHVSQTCSSSETVRHPARGIMGYVIDWTLESYLEILSRSKIPVGESIKFSIESNIEESWTEYQNIYGRHRYYALPSTFDISLLCPDICANLFPSGISLLSISKELITRSSNLDEKLRRSRLKNIDSIILWDDLLTASGHYVLLWLIVYLNRRGLRSDEQLMRIILACTQFNHTIQGYRQWFLFPGESIGRSDIHRGLKLVEHECRRCNARGWMLQITILGKKSTRD